MIEIEHLDLNIVRHCNMRCVSCSHASPFVKRWFMSLESAERDLLALKPFLKPKNVNLVGGEPTLHPLLADFMRLTKRIRLDDKTVVITNGTLLPRMSDDFWAELESLRVSVYPVLDRNILGLCERKAAEFGFDLRMDEVSEFYAQFDDVPDGSSFHDCHWRKDCYTVHEGFFYLCPQSAFFPARFLELPPTVDGLPLAGLTEEKLVAFMNRDVPFHACRICRSYGHPQPWKEASTLGEWLRESSVDKSRTASTLREA